MKIKTTCMSGTFESSDIMITISPNSEHGIVIELVSPVEKQFGREIHKVIEDTLRNLGIIDAKVAAVDKGALDCVIQARVKTAAYRASGENQYLWEGARQ